MSPHRTPAENFPDQDWDDVLQVNLNTVWILARDVGRHMLSSRGGVTGEEKPTEENPRGRGKIINIASLVSYQGQSAEQSPRARSRPAADQ